MSDVAFSYQADPDFISHRILFLSPLRHITNFVENFSCYNLSTLLLFILRDLWILQKSMPVYSKSSPINLCELLNKIADRIIYFITYLSTVVPFNICVSFPVDLSSLMRHFQTGLVRC